MYICVAHLVFCVALYIQLFSMESRSVVVKGLQDRSYEELSKHFSSAGTVEKIVKVLGSEMKFTGKAYVVYSKDEEALTAAMKFNRDTVTCQAVGKQDEEFKSLVEEGGVTELMFAQQWQMFSPSQQQMFLKMFGVSEPGVTGATAAYKSTASGDKPLLTSDSAARDSVSEDERHVVMHKEPQLPPFSGSGKDCSFGRWKHEVMCLKEDVRYSDSVVMEAVRKSLKSPAANVLPRLGYSPTVDQIVAKVESTYGSVLSGEVLLERFYSERQKEDESCAKWFDRIEDLVYQALQKKALTEEVVQSSLRQKFWSGLFSESIKDALRHRYEQCTCEELLVEARCIEEEKSSGKSDKERIKAKSHQVISDDKMDLLLKRLDKMDADIQELKRAQGRPAEQKPKPPVVCTKCSKEGHLSWGCKEGVQCHKCDLVGHLAKACRNKKKKDLN